MTLSAALCCAPAQAAAPVASHSADARAQAAALYDADWQWHMRHMPEWATAVGDNRYNNLLSDSSLAGSRSANAHEQEMLAKIKAINPASLHGQDLTSYQLFLYEKEKAVQGAKFYPYMAQPITQQDGIHIAFVQMVAQTPFKTARDYRNYIARLQAWPAYVDGIIAQLQEGVRTGWVAPKATMRIVPDQLKQLHEKLMESPIAAPFNDIPATISKAERQRLASLGKASLARDVGPALGKLEAYLRSTYLPAARDSISAAALPAGPAYYAFAVKENTTTDMTPVQIHALGLKEVARIQAEMKATIAQTGFKGDFAAFVAFVNSDPRFFYTSKNELLDGYRAIIKKTYVQLPALFAQLPRGAVDVKPVPEIGAEDQGAAYYDQGTPDGKRPGYFVANTSKLETRAKWEMETLTLHEAVPGHHLQVARAQEIAGLPNFRRFGWYVAFGEGWALYAESLGAEMGFYTDPYSMFGHLNDELFRAVRLVVDTGIHANGWSREQAIAYMDANTANPHSDNIVEVDRYIGWPGQALGYKIGQLKIRALRDKAQLALGDKFDVRGFHNAVIDNGALPLAVLEQQIDLWIEQQKKSAAAHAKANGA